MNFHFSDPYMNMLNGLLPTLPMVAGGGMNLLAYPLVHGGASSSRTSADDCGAITATFTRNDVVAFAEGDSLKLAHLVRPVQMSLTHEGLGGPTVHAETIPDDQPVELETNEIVVVERGLRLGDIVVMHSDSRMERLTSHGLKSARWIQKNEGRVGQVVERKLVADVKVLCGDMDCVLTDVSLDRSEPVGEVTYEWNKRTAQLSGLNPASYGREANFYLYENWIGEVLGQADRVEVDWNGHRFFVVLGCGSQAIAYERTDGADTRKKPIVVGDAVRIKIHDAVQADWKGVVPGELSPRKRSAMRRSDGILCTVIGVELYTVQMSWLRPNPLDASKVAEMMKQPPGEELTAEQLKINGKWLDRRRWPHTGDRCVIKREDGMQAMTWAAYEKHVHNTYAEKLELKLLEMDPNEEFVLPESFTAEVIWTRTEVVVQWQDGSLTSLPATKLAPANDLVEMLPRSHAPTQPPLLPSQIVKRKSEKKDLYHSHGHHSGKMKDGAYGIVMCADEKERIATIKWLQLTDGKVTDNGLPSEVMTYYDLETLNKHQPGDLSRCGDLCMRRTARTNEAQYEIFRVGKMGTDGKLVVRFWNGTEESLWPLEITQMMSGYEMVLQGPDGEIVEKAAFVPNEVDSMPPPADDTDLDDVLAVLPSVDAFPNFGGQPNADWGGPMQQDEHDMLMRDLAVIAGVARSLAPNGSGLQISASKIFDYWNTRADEIQKPFFDLSECVMRVMEFGLPTRDLSLTSLQKMLSDIESDKIPLGVFKKTQVLDRINQLIMHWHGDPHSTEIAIATALVKEDSPPTKRSPLEEARELFSILDVGRREERELLDEVPPTKKQHLMEVVRGGKAASPDGNSDGGSSVCDDPPSTSSGESGEREGTPLSPLPQEENVAMEVEDLLNPLKVLSSCPEQHYLSDPSPQPSGVFMKAIRKEMKLLKELPEGIFVTMYEDRIDLISALVVGPSGTPFEATPFLFDIKLPSDYPSNPPTVFYAANSVDPLNPNLYQDGKVCLSLLGTWSGKACERWNAAHSSITQVLVSIQALILNAEPYWNEPGYETRKEEKEEKENAERYNERVVLASLEYTERVLSRPPPQWAVLVRALAEKQLDGIPLRLSSLRSECPPFPLPPSTKGFDLSVEKKVENIKRALQETA